MAEAAKKDEQGVDTLTHQGALKVAEKFQRVARELQQTLIERDETISSLEAKIAALETELRGAEEELDGARDEARWAERDLREANETIDGLERELETMKDHQDSLINCRRALLSGRSTDATYHLDRVLDHIDSAWRTMA